MKPVKVKAYGLINFTKKQYTITQFIVFISLAALFLLSSTYDLDRFAFGDAKIAILIIAILEAVETFFMFKKYKEKELSNN